MKQDSEFLANYTVAKSTMNCDFNPPKVPVQKIKKREDGTNILDADDKLIWEDSTDFEYKYKIRYLNESGEEITKDMYNDNDNTYIAAFIGCTYHCG